MVSKFRIVKGLQIGIQSTNLKIMPVGMANKKLSSYIWYLFLYVLEKAKKINKIKIEEKKKKGNFYFKFNFK